MDRDFTINSFFSLDFAVFFLRLATGAMILFGHGIYKLIKFTDQPIRFGDPIGIGSAPSLVLAALAEVGCALLVIVGYKTRYALIPLIITMLVAAFISHLDDPWDQKELALLYFIPFLTIFLLGPGKYSLDYKWSAEKLS